MSAILDAILEHDQARIEALLAEDVRFVGPVVSRPYEGRALTSAILRGVDRVFEHLRFVRSIESSDGRDLAVLFEATVDGNEINGCDFLHVDDDGKIDDILVMVRPLSAAKDLSASLGAQFHQILAEAKQ